MSEGQIEVVSAFFSLSLVWEAESGKDVCLAPVQLVHGVTALTDVVSWYKSHGRGLGQAPEYITSALMQGELLAHRREDSSFKENKSLAPVLGLQQQEPCTGCSCPGTL